MIPVAALWAGVKAQTVRRLARRSAAVAVPSATPPAPRAWTPPGMESLTAEENAKYQAALRASQQDPQVLAARAEVTKAQQALQSAIKRMTEAQAQAMKAAGPEVAAITEKVEQGRKKWMEAQRAKWQRPAAPVAPAKVVPAAPVTPPAPVTAG